MKYKMTRSLITFLPWDCPQFWYQYATFLNALYMSVKIIDTAACNDIHIVWIPFKIHYCPDFFILNLLSHIVIYKKCPDINYIVLHNDKKTEQHLLIYNVK